MNRIFNISGRAMLAALLFSFVTISQAQEFRNPLDIPISFSGNYGELRSNHFHGGLDFRTGGAIGIAIHAPADGYVSRVSLSPYGYGKALYITHNNGYTTVYGHLSGFAKELNSIIISKQFEQRESNVDFELGPDIYPVKRGDIVAYTGNTGSSGGPHLHYEIRESATNLPLDALARGFVKSTHTQPPQIRKVAVIGYSEYNGVPQFGDVLMAGDKVLTVPKDFIVAVDAVDRQEGTPAALAVKEYTYYIDTLKFFHLNIGEVPFEQNRYINSLIHYPYRMRGGAPMIKSYVEEGNLISSRIDAVENGIVTLPDYNEHILKIDVADYAGNRTIRKYRIRRDTTDIQTACDSTDLDVLPEGVMKMDWALPNIYKAEGLEVIVPPAALYSNILFSADTTEAPLGALSKCWQIGRRDIPLHIGATIKIECNIADSLASKAFIARVDRGKEYIGGNYEEGLFTAKVRNFGKFTVLYDTKEPKILPTIKNGAAVRGNTLKFKISDSLSGINRYSVKIDDEWIPAFLDGKTSTLIVNLNDVKLKAGRHSVEVTVWDNCQNSNTYKGKFIK